VLYGVFGFSTHLPPTHKTPTKIPRGKSIFLSEALRLDGEECGGTEQGWMVKKCKRKTNKYTHRHMNTLSLSGWFVEFYSGEENFLLASSPKTKQQNRIIIFPRHKIKYLPHNLHHCYLPFTERTRTEKEKNMRILMASGWKYEATIKYWVGKREKERTRNL
jgi:hypothetical protein